MTTTTGNLTRGLAVLLLPVLLAACDTTAGAGRDISAAGQAITHGAKQNKSY